MKVTLLLSFFGLLSGFINGMLGTGGAIPLILLFTFLSFEAPDAFATANLVAMVLSFCSLILYLRLGTLEGGFLSDFFRTDFLPAILGGALGGILLNRVSPKLIKGVFCLVSIIGGMGVIFK